MTNQPIKKHILPIIVFSQFACTSLWFAGNAILPDLIQEYSLKASSLGHITSAVQLGFIVGTLIFALLTISDRFSPSKVFFICAIAGALSNLGILIGIKGLSVIIIFRFLTGFFLAGIYPVGMKIAADYHEKGLGKALGYLVGALVIGTALPHLLKGVTQSLNWSSVMLFTSGLSAIGGLLILQFVPNGPFRKKSQEVKLSAFFEVFKKKEFRAPALGYFGHMWELYAFWAFVPVILSQYNASQNAVQNAIQQGLNLNIPLYSFGIIAVGGIACIIGGNISQKKGSDRVAFFALLVSGVCCLISPFLYVLPSMVFLLILLIWGMAVVADSPQFSTLVAQSAPVELKGTALTIVNCIGFAITIVSIQVVNFLMSFIEPEYIYLILTIGPFFGLYAMYQVYFNK